MESLNLIKQYARMYAHPLTEAELREFHDGISDMWYCNRLERIELTSVAVLGFRLLQEVAAARELRTFHVRDWNRMMEALGKVADLLPMCGGSAVDMIERIGAELAAVRQAQAEVAKTYGTHEETGDYHETDGKALETPPSA